MLIITETGLRVYEASLPYSIYLYTLEIFHNKKIIARECKLICYLMKTVFYLMKF